MPINMNFSPCHLNTYNNISYLQRSQTLQPIRSNGLGLQDFSDPKQFLLYKYFTSQINSAMLDVGSPEKANYANVPHNKLEHLYPSIADLVDQKQDARVEHEHDRDHNHRHHHHHHHQRQTSSILGPLPPPSHSYHSMRQAEDLNRYYNIGQPLRPIRGEAKTTTNAPINVHGSHLQHHNQHHNHPQHHREHHLSHSNIQPLNNIDIMQVCNELGTLDSPPVMPSPRRYTITKASDQSLYKVPFPQGRMMGAQFFDPITGLVLSRGTPVNVLGPTRDDRSKLTICHQAEHIDLPHQLTEPPQLLRHEQLLQ